MEENIYSKYTKEEKDNSLKHTKYFDKNDHNNREIYQLNNVVLDFICPEKFKLYILSNINENDFKNYELRIYYNNYEACGEDGLVYSNGVNHTYIYFYELVSKIDNTIQKFIDLKIEYERHIMKVL